MEESDEEILSESEVARKAGGEAEPYTKMIADSETKLGEPIVSVLWTQVAKAVKVGKPRYSDRLRTGVS